MRFLYPILLAISLLPLKTFACMNTYNRLPGVSYELGGTGNSFYNLPALPTIDPGQLYQYISASKEHCNHNPAKACSDLVAALLYRKDFVQALDIAAALVEKYPEEYNIVITYAACLELNGKLAEARSMLEKAIRINPGSHKGSEWIHKNILDFRINGPDGHHSPLRIDFGNDAFPEDKGSIDTNKLIQQLYYQIEDRIFFEQPGDTLFGSLLFDYANLLYINNYRQASISFYEAAIGYGYNNDLIRTRLAAVKEQQAEKLRPDSNGKIDKRRLKKVALPLMAFVLAAISTLILIRKRRLRNGNKTTTE